MTSNVKRTTKDDVLKAHGVDGIHQIDAAHDIADKVADTAVSDLVARITKVDGPISSAELVVSIGLRRIVHTLAYNYLAAVITLISKSAGSNKDKSELLAEVENNLHQMIHDSSDAAITRALAKMCQE